MSKKIAYLVSNPSVSYGARIFIPYAHRSGHMDEYMAAHGHMKWASMWGGFDKDTGKCYGYEFGPGVFEAMKTYLMASGFTLVEESAENANEIWA
jgi:hypothetical protein